MFEPVRVFAEWCSGPRSGLADYGGRPHLYQSLWLDEDSPLTEDEYALVPVPGGAASELSARLLPLSSPAGRPTLFPGGDSGAWQAFVAAWEEFRTSVLAASGVGVRASGEMRPVPGVPVTGANDPLEVTWSIRGPVPVQAIRDRLAELDRRRAARRPPDELPPAGEEMPF